ncbi:MAG: retropepsin-like aspartic protease [Bacteroidota bacterium]
MKHTIPLDIIELEDKNFHVFIDLTVDGKSCRMLVDTGASKSVFDTERVLRFVKEHKIESNESKSVGLGVSDMETKAVTLRNLAIKKFTCKKMEVAILPLGHVNTTYELLKIPAIDGVLGSDFLVKYSAVIDLGKGRIMLYKK